MATTIDLGGQVALVTGGSRGIGRAIAIALGRAGAAVGVGYRGDARAAAEVARAIVDAGGRAAALQADLAEWTAAERLVDACARSLGPIDHLIVNHGIWKRSPIESMAEHEWDEMASVNLKSAMALCRFAAPGMRARGRGRIILIASTAGQRGEAEHAHYAATKGAIISLTKSLAPELAPSVLVNCVAPGWVATEMTAATLADPGAGEAVRRAIPLGRPGRPDEIAGAVLFLCSDLATFVTGEIVNVNGGAVLVG